MVTVALMMEAVCTSEMSVYIYKPTWHHIPEGCHLHKGCCKNLKSHIVTNILFPYPDSDDYMEPHPRRLLMTFSLPREYKILHLTIHHYISYTAEKVLLSNTRSNKIMLGISWEIRGRRTGKIQRNGIIRVKSLKVVDICISQVMKIKDVKFHDRRILCRTLALTLSHFEGTTVKDT
jgi:hypothetical protein